MVRFKKVGFMVGFNDWDGRVGIGLWSNEMVAGKIHKYLSKVEMST